MSTPPVNQFPPIGPKKDKFTPELRILAASLLSLAVIILWTKYFGPKPPEHAPQPNQPGVSAPATSGTSAATPAPAESAPSAEPSTVSAAAAPTAPLTEDTQERTIVVENDLYRVEFSNHGAVVKSWQLKKYKDDCDGKRKDDACLEGKLAKPQGTLDLVHKRSAEMTGGWPFSMVIDDPQLEKAANTGLYKVSGDSLLLPAPADLIFTWSDGHLEVTKKFHFGHSYVLTVETSVIYNGAPLHGGLAWRGGFGDLTVTNPIPVETVNTFYSEGGKLSTFAHKKLDAREKWGTTWAPGKTFAGIADRYFAVAFLPPSETPGTLLETRYWKVWDTVRVEDKDQSEPVPEVAVDTNSQPMALRVFAGPKDYDDLKAIHPPLHSLVQFGEWLGIIADPLFHGLKWLHTYIPSWGWAIVALTLIVNMVLFPLRISSYKTTIKMQRVGPEIKQIQEKYKKYKMNDPRKAEMNKEVMAIYSREGINPIGGCLPMVLQFPIWFGLNRALSYAIELRHANWLWVRDLASKDPYYVLPVMVGVSMYLVSKMTPMTITDPQQATMMKLMPISMAFMFVIFPFSSGLALYILTSSLVGILQQWYLNRTHPLPAPVKPVRAKK